MKLTTACGIRSLSASRYTAPVMVPLKRRLPFDSLRKRRLLIGLLAGFAFALTFYAGSVLVARATIEIMRARPGDAVVSVRYSNEMADELGLEAKPVPAIVGPADIPIPQWFAPFWAGLAAAFGQAFALYVWFYRASKPWSVRGKRAVTYFRGAVATGMMWVGILPFILIKIWLIYVLLIFAENAWSSAFGQETAADPFAPVFRFGVLAALLVLLVSLEPWKGLRLAYRCRWWPALGAAITFAYAAILYFAGTWLLMWGAV